MEVPQDSIVVGIHEVVAEFFSENESQLCDILNRERWDVRLHQLQTVNIFVGFLLRKDRRFVEATKTINELLEGFLVALAIALVLSLTKLLGSSHFINKIAHVLVQLGQSDTIGLNLAEVHSHVLDFNLRDLLPG